MANWRYFLFCSHVLETFQLMSKESDIAIAIDFLFSVLLSHSYFSLFPMTELARLDSGSKRLEYGICLYSNLMDVRTPRLSRLHQTHCFLRSHVCTSVCTILRLCTVFTQLLSILESV